MEQIVITFVIKQIIFARTIRIYHVIHRKMFPMQPITLTNQIISSQSRNWFRVQIHSKRNHSKRITISLICISNRKEKPQKQHFVQITTCFQLKHFLMLVVIWSGENCSRHHVNYSCIITKNIEPPTCSLCSCFGVP